MDPTRRVNPYIAGSPVTGTEMFFGREDVFSFVRRNLTGRHRDTPIVLYGQRRTGKTSVLYQMHRHLDARYRCIFVDLHGLNLNGMENLLWGLATSIRRGLQRYHQLNVAVPDRATFSADPQAAFETAFLDTVWSILGEDHLVLMIDEVVRLHEEVRAGRLEREVFDYLRYLMQHFERLNFVFSLGSGVEEMKKDYAFLFGVALYHRISFLEPMAARALITKPAQDCYQVTPDAAETILQITSGHPYYTQLVCHCLFDRWLRAPEPQMTSADVEAVLPEAIELGSANLTYVWEDSTPEEQAMMAGMAAAMPTVGTPATADQIREVWREAGVWLPEGQAASAARNLTAREVVVASDGGYAFAVDLQRLWLGKHRRLDWVKQELEEPARRWLDEPALKQDRPAGPAGEDMPDGPGPHGGGRLFSRRSIIAAAAAAVAVIGVVAAIVIIPGTPPTDSTPGGSATASTNTAPTNGTPGGSAPACGTTAGGPNLFACVNLNGTLAHGNHVTGVTHIGTGQYEVTFSANVQQCAYVATTINAHSSQALQVFTAGGQQGPDGVYVETKNQGDALTDGPFNLVVDCGLPGWSYAVVGYNADLVRSTLGVNLTSLSDGRYDVTFPADISRCAYLATVGDPGTGAVSEADGVYTGSGSNPNTVYVETKNPGGGLLAGIPFHLAVICPTAASATVAVVAANGLISRGSPHTRSSRPAPGQYTLVANRPLSACAAVATRGSIDTSAPYYPDTVEIVPGTAPNTVGIQVRLLASLRGNLDSESFHAALVC